MKRSSSALLAALALASVSLLALDRLMVDGFATSIVVGELAAVAVTVVVALAVVERFGIAPAIGASIAAAVISATVLARPIAEHDFAPSSFEPGRLADQLHHALSVVTSSGTPVEANAGIVMLMTAIAAMVAALAIVVPVTLAGRAGWLLFPTLMVVVYSALVSADRDRTATAATVVAAAAAVLAAGRSPASRAGSWLRTGRRQVALVSVLALVSMTLIAGRLLDTVRLSVLQIHPPPVPVHPVVTTTTTTTTTLPTPTPTSAPSVAATPVPAAGTGATAPVVSVHHSVAWLFVLVGLLVLMVMAALWWWSRRRIRTDDPNRLVVLAFERMQRALRPRSVRRARAETPQEFAQRLTRSATPAADVALAVANLAEIACFSPSGCTAADAIEAQDLARHFVRHQPRRLRRGSRNGHRRSSSGRRPRSECHDEAAVLAIKRR